MQQRDVVVVARHAPRDPKFRAFPIEGASLAVTGQRIVSAYNKNCYHQPGDEFDPGWTFSGTIQEASVAYALGRELANSNAWPWWKAGNEFKPLRETTEAERVR